MLELDYTNVLESTIGLSHGIPKIAFDKASESSKHVVEHIQKAHERGELGFGNLPFDDAPVKAVTSFAKSHGQRNLLLLGIGGSALGPALSGPYRGWAVAACHCPPAPASACTPSRSSSPT
jgi:hypothetical protein